MIKESSFQSSEQIPRDVTLEFMRGAREFSDFSHENQLFKEPSLKIHLDLTEVSDMHIFRTISRRAKAFLEGSNSGQKRIASIRCTKEQKAWEYNVFGSGVVWDEAK